jgi:hypothetical protein
LPLNTGASTKPATYVDDLQVLGGEDDDGSREHANYCHMEPSHGRPFLCNYQTENRFPQNALKYFNVPLYRQDELDLLVFCNFKTRRAATWC